jgi:RNA polymerase sigma factor (sigma-70 family)
MQISDTELMLRVRDGDLEASRYLYDRYHAHLYNFFLRLCNDRETSRDMTQDVFFRLLKYRKSYLGCGNFKTWLFRIAHNVSIDFYRQKGRLAAADQDPFQLESQEAHPAHEMELRQDITDLRTALEKLSKEKREAIILSKFQHLKCEEIAKIQGCQVGNVKTRIHRAMKELAKNYSQITGAKI